MILFHRIFDKFVTLICIPEGFLIFKRLNNFSIEAQLLLHFSISQNDSYVQLK